jgi:hypothetical protein
VGFEALIDTRTPREPKVAQASRQALQAARAANARVTTAEALQILRAQGIAPLPSESTIKREFARVDDRREYAAKKRLAAHEVVELPFAGGELLLAAEAETGGIAALRTCARPRRRRWGEWRRGRASCTSGRRRLPPSSRC